MATRFFLSRRQDPYGTDDPPIVTPSAGWAYTSGYVRQGLSLSPQALAFTTKSTAVTPNASEYDVLLFQAHSEPMAAQTIGAVTFHGVLRVYQAVLVGGLMMQYCVRVVGTDGTVRGTLLDLHSETVLNSTFAGSYTNRMVPPPAISGAMSSLVVLDGDRLVVEIGYRAIGSSGSSVTGYFDMGSNSGTSLADDERGTEQYSPWIEFAQDIVFFGGSARSEGSTLRVSTASRASPGDAISLSSTPFTGPAVSFNQDMGHTRGSPPMLAYGRESQELPPVPGGGPTPITTHYHKRAWRTESAAFVEWDTTDPLAPYPDGGTLDPPLGVVVYEWT